MKYIMIPFGALALMFTACTQEETATTEAEAAAEVAVGDAEAYPLDVCIVSGEKLGSMGEPVVTEYEGRTVKFCCAECQPKFEEDPDQYLSQLEN